jgi:hypothetical protein
MNVFLDNDGIMIKEDKQGGRPDIHCMGQTLLEEKVVPPRGSPDLKLYPSMLYGN